MARAKKILIAEDNDFIRMQIVSFLSEAGYQSVEARDGKSALKEAEGDLSLIIADIRMEPMGGFEFIKVLRSEGKKTPVILVTGDETPSLLNEATKLGVSAVLKKPVNKERLIGTISRTIGVERRNH